MDYVLLNSDGSVKQTNFTQSIQQNNNGTNEIFVSVDDLDVATHTLEAFFTLPDGTHTAESGVVKSNFEYESGKTADGFLVTLTQNETIIPGIVYLTLAIFGNPANAALYSYRVALTINPTVNVGEIVWITYAQYTNLKSYIDTTFVTLTTYNNDISAINDALPTKVPYSGAIGDVNLGNHSITAKFFNCATGSVGESTYDIVIASNADGDICLEPWQVQKARYNGYEIATTEDMKVQYHQIIINFTTHIVYFQIYNHSIDLINTVAKIEELIGDGLNITGTVYDVTNSKHGSIRTLQISALDKLHVVYHYGGDLYSETLATMTDSMITDTIKEM